MTEIRIDGQIPSGPVAVALSGGVDSAATASLLVRGGAQVFGVTMLLKKEDRPDDARAVAEALGIPLHVVDLTERFSSCVMADFAAAYQSGETPNPCVLCNRSIKFGDLMEIARSYGAGALATGHYVRRVVKDGRAELHQATDQTRDQSYFLFALRQAQIDFACFPLGGAHKPDVRAYAQAQGLPVAHKPDSQDICFIPSGDYASFVARFSPQAAQNGDIVDQKGVVLGKHDGIVHFTVGQRRGLALGRRTGDKNDPLFVIALDAEKRQVVVGPREALSQSLVRLRDVNWLGDTLPQLDKQISVKLRSTQQPMPARFSLDTDGAGRIVLETPVLGVSPGQAGVIYEGTRVLGGGWIVK